MKSNDPNERLMAETRRFAHDLRGPVLALQSVLKAQSSGGGGAEYNDILEQSTERLLQMSQDLLRVFKTPSYPNPSNKRELISIVFLRRILRKSLQEFLLFNSHSQTKICFKDFTKIQMHHDHSHSGKQSVIVACKTDLERIFLNLLTNSFEACEERLNSKVLVTSYIDEQSLKIEIQDNGCGMSDDEIGLALDGISSKTNGNGIGLSSAISTLDEWGARLDVESQKGMGTTVIFSFPMEHQTIN